jgi:hypothetical protein
MYFVGASGSRLLGYWPFVRFESLLASLGSAYPGTSRSNLTALRGAALMLALAAIILQKSRLSKLSILAGG